MRAVKESWVAAAGLCTPPPPTRTTSQTAAFRFVLCAMPAGISAYLERVLLLLGKNVWRQLS